MADRRRLLVALVITGPVATELDGLRKALGSREVARIPPHLTLVPPTNVAAADLEGVHATLRAAAAASRPLSLTLGPLATFAPAGRVVYLVVSGDLAALRTLRAALFCEPFQKREEERPFVAHVTLTNRATPEERDGALLALAHYAAPVRVETLTLLAEEEGVAGHPWHAVADVSLRPASLVGRGGRELTFSTGSLLDEHAAAARDAWLSSAGDAPSRAPQGPVAPSLPATGSAVPSLSGAGFYATAREHSPEGGEELVAVASGRERAGELFLETIVVTPAARGLGIGTQLVGFLEQAARERGIGAVVVDRAAAGSAAAFFSGRGYAPATPDALLRLLGS